MRIAIVGLGAVGGLIAARLALAGAKVSALARGRTCEVVARDGLRLLEAAAPGSPERERIASLRVEREAAALGEQDVVVIALKAPALAPVAPVLAPLLGSYLMLVTNWRAIFVFMMLFGMVMLYAIVFRLGETRSDATEATARGEHPIAALRLLATNRKLLGYMLASACNSACLFTYISASPALIMGTYGVSPTGFGWLFGLNALGLIIASQINRAALARFHADSILAVASVAAALFGLALLAIALLDVGGLPAIMAMLFGILSSFGFMMGNASAGALSVDPVRAGSISALMGAAGFTVGGLTMTIATLFADGTAIPMAAVMCVSLMIAAMAFFGLTRRAAPRTDDRFHS